VSEQEHCDVKELGKAAKWQREDFNPETERSVQVSMQDQVCASPKVCGRHVHVNTHIHKLVKM